MPSLWRHCSPRERRNFIALAVFVALAILLGGGSRGDVASLPIVYAGAVLMIGAAILQLEGHDWRRVRTPLSLLGGLALLMIIQLLPLPPSMWRALAGRESFAAGLDMVGLAQTWRPASLTPDLTLYALIAVLVPAAVLLVGVMAGRLLPAMVPVLLGLCALSALVGLLQAVGSLSSFYRITNQGAAVGLFANRNHQAALLVCAFPLTAVWATWPDADPATRSVRGWIGLCAGAILVPMLMVTGSRGGVLFGAVSVLASLVLLWTGADRRTRRSARRSPVAVAALVATVLLPMIVTFLFARDLAVQRLLAGAEGELRSQFLPVYLNIIDAFFPWGSGFGSFDAVFRGYEPHAALSQTYLNHAHNEVAELLIEGGAGAALLAAGFVAWAARRSWVAWRRPRGSGALLGRAGSVIVGVLILWSLVDYPLRTPSLSAVTAVACLFLIARADGRSPEPGLGRRPAIR